jgi:hypothetical protein
MPIQTNLILHTVKSGLTFQLTPLTLLGQQHFKDLARKAHPDPDPEPYEKPEINGFLPDQKTAATDDPEYRRLVVEASIKRDFAYQVLVLENCVSCDGKQALIDVYTATNANGMAVWLGVPKEHGDNLSFDIPTPWAQLLYMSLCSQAEINEMLLLIQGRLPLEEGEILQGFRYFRRLALQRQNGTGTDSTTGALPVAATVESNPVAS